jgi:hypothetical protein
MDGNSQTPEQVMLSSFQQKMQIGIPPDERAEIVLLPLQAFC